MTCLRSCKVTATWAAVAWALHSIGEAISMQISASDAILKEAIEIVCNAYYACSWRLGYLHDLRLSYFALIMILWFLGSVCVCMQKRTRESGDGIGGEIL